MTIDKTERIINWFSNIEESILKIIDIIPFSPANSKIEIPILAPIIVEAGSLLDTIFKELCNKGYDNMPGYAEYFEPKYELSKIKSIILKYPLEYCQPFKDWFINNKYQKPDWWESYNGIKHNRLIEYSKCTNG